MVLFRLSQHLSNFFIKAIAQTSCHRLGFFHVDAGFVFEPYSRLPSYYRDQHTFSAHSPLSPYDAFMCAGIYVYVHAGTCQPRRN